MDIKVILFITCKNEDDLISSLILMIKKHVKEQFDNYRGLKLYMYLLVYNTMQTAIILNDHLRNSLVNA